MKKKHYYKHKRYKLSPKRKNLFSKKTLGIILFKRNIKSLNQLKQLTKKYKKINKKIKDFQF